MSDNLFEQAPFLRAQKPTGIITDYSGMLNSSQIDAISSQVHQSHYQAKIVILPKDFSPDNVDAFAHSLASHLGADTGSRLFMLIDLKGKHMRVHASGELHARGVDKEFLDSQVYPAFTTVMKQHGNLQTAISNSLDVVEKQASSQLTAASAAEGSPYQNPNTTYRSAPVSGDAGSDMSWLWQLGFVVVVGLAVFAFLFKSRSNKNKQLEQTFNERANLLYQKADEIGQASEYLDVSKYAELAQRAAAFFNQLTTLEKAQKEVSGLVSSGKVWTAGNGLVKCLKLSEVLQPEAEALLNEINGVTGGVKTFSPPSTSNDEKIKSIAAGDDKISIPALQTSQKTDRFRRPAWSTEPAYMPGPGAFSGGGLFNLMFLLNQMEMNNRLDNLSYQMHNDGGNWFGGGNSGSDSGGSWGGGDWGGGDIGGGDWGGGDWGGGGDW